MVGDDDRAIAGGPVVLQTVHLHAMEASEVPAQDGAIDLVRQDAHDPQRDEQIGHRGDVQHRAARADPTAASAAAAAAPATMNSAFMMLLAAIMRDRSAGAAASWMMA